MENRTLPGLNFYGISLKRKKHQTLGTSNNKCHGFYDHGLYGHLVVFKKTKTKKLPKAYPANQQVLPGSVWAHGRGQQGSVQLIIQHDSYGNKGQSASVLAC